MGDRPARVMADIEGAEHKKGSSKAPQGSTDVAHQPSTGGPGHSDNHDLLPPSHGSSGSGGSLPNDAGYLANSMYAAHQAAENNGSGQPSMTGDLRQASTAPSALQVQRGLQYIAEGRMLESQSRLLEAMQRYQEAQRLLGPPEPGHDDPAGEAIIALRSTAYRDVNHTLDGIADAVKDAARDPSRYQKVDADLVRARQIAAAFQLDVAAVDQKVSWVSAVKNGTKAPQSDFIPDMTAGTQEGQDLIKKGYICLRDGKLTEARKISRHAFEPSFGVQEYAKQLSRRIDDEELNQRRMAENRSFDSGKERYNQKDYVAARQILDQINVRMLDTARQSSFREVMNDPQMRAAVVQTGGPSGEGAPPNFPGKVNGDLPPATVMQDDILRKAEMQQDLTFQKLQGESRDAQSKAIEAERQGDLEGALTILKQESDKLSHAELSPDKVATLRRPVEHRIQEFNTIKAQVELQKTRDDGKFIEWGSKSPHELSKKLKEKQVADLMDQYGEFMQDHKYADAIRVATLACDLDPDNAQCQFALKSAEMEIKIARQQELHNRKDNSDYQLLYQSDDIGTMPENGMLAWDPKYADRIKKRDTLNGLDKGISLGTKNAIEKEIEHRLYSPVNLKFVDRPLEDVVKDIGHLQGINVTLDTPALAEMGINPKQPISFEFGQGAALKSGLDLMLSQLHLTYMIQSEALVITTEQRAQGKLERKVFYVPDLVTPRPNTPNAPHVLGMQSNSSVQDNTPAPTVSGGSVVSPGQVAASAGQNSKTGSNQVIKGPPTIEGELIRLITNAVAPDTWAERGGHGTIDYYPLGGELIVNQTPDILEQVQDLLTALRRMQDLEVSVEIRLVTVSDNFFERIGVDFSANILTNNHKYDQQLVSGQFQQPGFIGGFEPKNFVSGMQFGGAFTPDLNIPIQTQSFQATPVPSFAFPGAGPIGGLDVGIAFLSDIQLYMFLEAVQYDQRAHIMQAPKIMMFNGQQATLSVTTDFFLTTGLNVQQVSGHIIATPNSSLLPNGVSISVVPIVSADRRFVRLDINQTMTNIGTINIFPITALAFNSQVETTSGLVTVQPPLVFTNFMQQPSVETLTVSTSVNVPDGGTVVMGGFKALAEGRNEAGPPILSKIPYVDRLFRNVSYGRSSQHLVMLVTPRIIITEEEEINATGISGANFGPGATPLP
jgi:type II secretory pathway component GspD/PulD (secretin)